MRKLHHLAILVSIAMLCACGDPSEEPKPSSDLVIEPLMYTPEAEPVALLQDGGDIDFFLPPQGGFVVLVGAQIDHTDSDVVDLEATLKNAATGELVMEDSRMVRLQRLPGHPTKFITDRRSISQVVHLTLCPSENAAGAKGVELELELKATELYSDFSTGSATLRVTPMCREPQADTQAYCECLCGADYKPGKCFTP